MMTTPSSQEITRLLSAWKDGDQAVPEKPIHLVHVELCRLTQDIDKDRSAEFRTLDEAIKLSPRMVRMWVELCRRPEKEKDDD
jgi:hypothetical protein